jgi:hypothetical protein
VALEVSNQGESDGWSMTHAWERERERERERNVHRGLWWGNLKEGVNLEDLSVDGSIILKRTLNE